MISEGLDCPDTTLISAFTLPPSTFHFSLSAFRSPLQASSFTLHLSPSRRAF